MWARAVKFRVVPRGAPRTSGKFTKKPDSSSWMVVQRMDSMKATSWLGAITAQPCSTWEWRGQGGAGQPGPRPRCWGWQPGPQLRGRSGCDVFCQLFRGYQGHKAEPDCPAGAHSSAALERTCEAMRYMTVLIKALLNTASAPGRSPAMPYTVRPKTHADTIWNGVMAEIWRCGGGGREGREEGGGEVVNAGFGGPAWPNA
jgi:hypothetical protein